MPIKTHWTNPWAHAVPVPLEELADLVAGGNILTKEGFVPYDRAFILNKWCAETEKLDAYLLPGGLSGAYVSAGVRYGREGRQYLSPMITNQAKAKALLDKYSRV